MPLISISTTSPGRMFGVAPSAPSQTTSPGWSVLYRLILAIWLAASKSMCLVLNWIWTWPLIRIVVSRLLGSRSVAIQGPIGLKVSEFLARHREPSWICQVRWLTSVADGIAQDTAQGALRRQVPGLFADHRYQFPLYLELIRCVFGFDDVLFMRDEGVIGTISDAWFGGGAGWGARVLRPPLDMFWIIEPTRIEGWWDHGHQEFYLVQGVGGCGHSVGLEGGAGDLGHAYSVLHNPIADFVPDLKATPFHRPLLYGLRLVCRITTTASMICRNGSACSVPTCETMRV